MSDELDEPAFPDLPLEFWPTEELHRYVRWCIGDEDDCAWPRRAIDEINRRIDQGLSPHPNPPQAVGDG